MPVTVPPAVAVKVGEKETVLVTVAGEMEAVRVQGMLALVETIGEKRSPPRPVAFS